VKPKERGREGERERERSKEKKTDENTQVDVGREGAGGERHREQEPITQKANLEAAGSISFGYN
jgi:hypothetical protein